MRTLEEILREYEDDPRPDAFDRLVPAIRALGRSEMEAEVTRLRAEGEERERALREIEALLYRKATTLGGDDERVREAWELARAALRPHKEEGR